MTDNPLRLNAKILGDTYRKDRNHPYIMSDLVDDRDQVIPGYGSSECPSTVSGIGEYHRDPASQEQLFWQFAKKNGPWTCQSGRGIAGDANLEMSS